jgi:hypothetical protein
MKMRVVSATEFKAKCLAMLDEVAGGGESSPSPSVGGQSRH